MTTETIPYRRVVPSGYAHGTLTLVGTSALLMNSGEADPDSDEYRAFVNLGKKRGKSLDDEARLREMEWALGLYIDDKVGPYIPGKNIHELLRSAGTKWKKGAEILRSLVVVDNRVPLLYEGPRAQNNLWEDGYRYVAMVGLSGPSKAKVRRCRPCFDDWSIEVELAWDPEDLDYDTLQLVAERAQKYGLGDYRPIFGTFASKLSRDGVSKDGVVVNGSRLADARFVKAHKAAKERIGL